MIIEEIPYTPRRPKRCDEISKTRAEYHLRQHNGNINVITIPRCMLAARYKIGNKCYCRQHTGDILIAMALKGQLVEKND